jgi:Zn-finger nucleic acid-binding protein
MLCPLDQTALRADERRGIEIGDCPPLSGCGSDLFDFGD